MSLESPKNKILHEIEWEYYCPSCSSVIPTNEVTDWEHAKGPCEGAKVYARPFKIVGPGEVIPMGVRIITKEELYQMKRFSSPRFPNPNT